MGLKTGYYMLCSYLYFIPICSSSVKNKVLLLAGAGLISCSFSGMQFFRETNGHRDLAATPTPLAVVTVSVNALLERQKIAASVETVAHNETALAAQVNGEPILLASYEVRASKLESALQAQGLNPDNAAGQARLIQLKQQLLDGLIEQKIIEQQAKLLGLAVTDAEVEAQAKNIKSQMSEAQFEIWLADNGFSDESFLTDLRAELLAGKLFDQVTKTVPTHTEQVLLRLIQVDDRASAQQIVEQLKADASFESQAQIHSQDETTRSNGGLLGWMPARLTLVPPEVEEVAFSMQAGELGGPVAADNGFYIIKVDDRAADRELTEIHRQQFKKQIFTDWLKQQWATATVERFISM
jgi:parvulin-like peptidyl-prolyl isomerase